MEITRERASDRNLLFGVLALQLNFIGQEALVAGMQELLRDEGASLPDMLEKSGQLSPQRRQLLEALVQEHLVQHKQDVCKSLAALPSLEMAEELLKLAETGLNRTLPGAETLRRAPDPNQTIAVPASERTHRYSVLRPLGKGGLGLVWVAMDAELHREVALKEIQPRLASDCESRVRFVREAEITGGLEHPGIVPVYGLGAYPDGRLFYAMRLIRGESLRVTLERFHTKCRDSSEIRAAGLRRLLKPFLDACNAVAYAHSRRVLHRDLKPDNIMLGRFGETLVVDWGLAKTWVPQVAQQHQTAAGPAESETIGASPAGEGPLRISAGSASSATQMGSMLGTPQFMSPEQAEGRLDCVSPASDIYGLGATLYCLLTGEAPFAGSDAMEVLQHVRRGQFRRPRQVRRDVPPPLEAICLKAMALRPDERYATASELADDIDRWLADEPVSAYAEPWRQRVSRWSRRHRAWTRAAAMALAAVALTATLAAVFVGQAWQNEASAVAEVSRHLKREEMEHDRAVRARQEADAARHAMEEAQTELARQITMLGLEEQLRQSVQSKPLLWEIAADRIQSQYERLRVPTAGDVSMQSWPAFRAGRSERLAGRTTIYLMQIGALSAEQQDLAGQMDEFLGIFYGLSVRWLDPIQATVASDSIAVQRLMAKQHPRDAVVVLGIAGGQGTSVFRGEHAAGPAAVIYFSSLSALPSDTEDRVQILRRLLKTAVCLVGQAVGIRDFAAYHCGMNAAASLSDLDAKPLAFCPECEQKVWWLCDMEPLERYKGLVQFASRYGLEAERRHWRQMLDVIHSPVRRP
jgi:serine/threonine protein kinase